jgi:hypothetical protein
MAIEIKQDLPLANGTARWYIGKVAVAAFAL